LTRVSILFRKDSSYRIKRASNSIKKFQQHSSTDQNAWYG